jgi:hypothetical protein
MHALKTAIDNSYQSFRKISKEGSIWKLGSANDPAAVLVTRTINNAVLGP